MTLKRSRQPGSIQESEFAHGKYDPTLKTFLLAAANRFSASNEFYRDQVHEDVPEFFDAHERQTNQSTYFTFMGKAGIGKTSFIQDWTTVYSVPHGYFNANNLNVQENVSGQVLKQFINQLRPLVLSSPIKETVYRKADELKNLAGRNDDEFASGFLNQTPAFRETYEWAGDEMLLAVMISAATETETEEHGQRVWLFFDNGDLQPREIQEEYFTAASRVFTTINDVVERYSWQSRHTVVVSVRPETYHMIQHYDQCVTYRLKSILPILTRRLETAFEETAADFDKQQDEEGTETGVNMPMFDRTFYSYSDLGSFVLRQITNHLDERIWPSFDSETSQYDADRWHMNLVDQDVRRLLNFWVHFLLSGNFLELVLPGGRVQPTRFTYQRAIFRGRYREFPGNGKFRGNSENHDSPVIINIFETYGRTDSYVPERMHVKNYFLAARVLQFLESHGRTSYAILKQALGKFFDVKRVERCVKWLLWSRLVEEDEVGVRNITLRDGPEAISLPDESRLGVSDAGAFYVFELLRNYQYLSAIAPTTRQIPNHLNTAPTRHYYHDDLCIALAVNLLDILETNVSAYRQADAFTEFLEKFVVAASYHPVAMLLDCCETTLNKKQDFLEQTDNGERDEHYDVLLSMIAKLKKRLDSMREE